MLETKVIGSKDWAEGFLNREDIRLLEDFDCEMRIRHQQQREGGPRVKTYAQLVEEQPETVPTQCEHGIPLYRRCGICRALRG